MVVPLMYEKKQMIFLTLIHKLYICPSIHI